jgi:hypothetical protein
MPLSPRSIMLLLIGFMGGLSVSFIRMSLATWGSAVGLRLPRSMVSLGSSSGPARAPAASRDAPAAGRGGAGKGGSGAAGGAAAAAAAPPAAPVIAAAVPKAPTAAHPPICNSTASMTEGPHEWHIMKQSELDEEAYPCHWTNLTHWALAYYHKVTPIKMCTHDPEVDTVISSHLHKYGE